MCRLQVYNWGTFEKLHTIPIAEKGFLFVGRSGSGKTTLLDAISTLLVPPKWIHYNAAAQDNERKGRDRSMVTYVRGAWAEQKDGGSGEVATQYLRKGTVWSAIALTFRKTNGREATLVQLFWIRGNLNGPGDVHRHFMILERAFDLTELDDFDLDVRRLKQAFPDARHTDQFSTYCERFRALLEIESEMALRLLHRTQSAKNLGDLNVFLRDYMLDRPPTFDVADTLVNEFGELNEAHQAVITAREQVQTLGPARGDYARRNESLVERAGLEGLVRELDGYRDVRRLGLLDDRIGQLKVRAQGLSGEVRALEDALENSERAQRDLEEQHRRLGGGQIETLEAEKGALDGQRAERLRKRAQVQDACRNLGWASPDSPQAFADMAGDARRELEGWQAWASASRERQVDLAASKREAEKEFAGVVKEVEALKRQPSNIPSQMLELRGGIAAALGVGDDSLPFAGELIEVKASESAWRGAIERVLHGFALSILVEDRHYASLSNHVNGVHLGARLVYYRTQPGAASSRVPGIDSLPRKLEIKECRHRAWLEAELEQRFDYACVDSTLAFRKADRALTREGQVRHGKDRNEKDDRHRIDDRRRWVLGFDNRDKRALFEAQARELAEKIEGLARGIDALAEEEDTRRGRAMSCQGIANTEWREIDTAPIEERVRGIDLALERLREGNAALDEIGRALEKRKALTKRADGTLRDKRVDAKRNDEVLAESVRKREELRAAATGTRLLAEDLRERLDARFEALREAMSLDNLDKQTALVERGLSAEIGKLRDEQSKLDNAIENRFAEFKRRWPMEAGDVDATLPSAPDFLAKLDRLESDGLPAHEKRFFDLLQTQSHQNLASLGSHLQQAQREIRDRMEMVNEGLGEAEFNPGTHLRIDVSDRQLAEVREFKQEIRQALSHAFTDEREMAEQRFVVLRRLVQRLASQEPADRRWRELALDVRQHVEFIGRELDREGAEIEVYRSGAGKSGGQRQKLATTCLAAALRYQLGGSGDQVPSYAPVVLDEAFDKADNEFTALAMNIFASFGFQMIVATPLKSVMTLEPFIGGACFVDIGDRQRSSVLLIEYDDERQRLNLPEPARDEAPVITS